MTAPANLRGWGQGWPVDRSADMRTVRAWRSGVDFTVHHEIAPIIKHLIDEVERRGYLLDHGVADVDDDWSYANRPIRGRRVPSNHSWGLAIDIDAQTYPLGSYRRLPQWVVDLFAHYRFDYGGNYRGRKDPMHFEFNGWPSNARWLVGSLTAHHLEASPPPTPITVPPPTPRRQTAMYFVIKDDPKERRRKFACAPDAGFFENLTDEQWQARAFLSGAVAQEVTALELMIYVDRHKLRDVTKVLMQKDPG